MPFKTVNDVKQANERLGHHWFSPETLRFFSSRIGRTLYGGRYFITSEQYDHNAPRRYSIREASPDGSVRTIGKFQQYATNREAQKAIKAMLVTS
jgi:hypothetical protein